MKMFHWRDETPAGLLDIVDTGEDIEPPGGVNIKIYLGECVQVFLEGTLHQVTG